MQKRGFAFSHKIQHMRVRFWQHVHVLQVCPDFFRAYLGGTSADNKEPLLAREGLFHRPGVPATLHAMAAYNDVADEELMLAYQRGDARAFESLYARHKGPLYRFMLRSCSHNDVAEEMFQDVWVRAIKARGGYRPVAKFSTWLYRIASNRLIDHYRQQGKWDQYLERDGADEVTDCVAAGEHEQPEQQAHANHQMQRLLFCLEQLPAPQLQTFLLKEEAGLAIEEISAAVSCDREAIKSRMRYAIRKLRQCMGELL